MGHNGLHMVVGRRTVGADSGASPREQLARKPPGLAARSHARDIRGSALYAENWRTVVQISQHYQNYKRPSGGMER
jgi:hypothetical protein